MSVPGRGGIGVLTGEPHVGPWETLKGFSFIDGPLRPVYPRLWRLTGLNCPSLASLFSFWVQLQSTPFPNLLQGPNQPGLSLSKSLLYFWKYSALCVVFHRKKDQIHILMGFSSERSKGTGRRYKLFLTITSPIVEPSLEVNFSPLRWPLDPPASWETRRLLSEILSFLFSLWVSREHRALFENHFAAYRRLFNTGSLVPNSLKFFKQILNVLKCVEHGRVKSVIIKSRCMSSLVLFMCVL